jgi:hypothetical protein
MSGMPVEITPLGDLLMYGGIAFLAILGCLAVLIPRIWRATRRPL